MKHTLLAGLSALAFSGCSMLTLGGPPPDTTVAQADAPAPAAQGYRILSREEIERTMPHMAAGGDKKAYVAAFIHWITEYGHLKERGETMPGGAPPDLKRASEFGPLVSTLADEGNTDAMVFIAFSGGEPGDEIDSIDHPLVPYFRNLRHVRHGSLAQKIAALAWLRQDAKTNPDSAFGLGQFLITQGGAFGPATTTAGIIATPDELKEGVQLIRGVAHSASLRTQIEIANLLDIVSNTPAGDDPLLRQLLEMTVAGTASILNQDVAHEGSLINAVETASDFETVFRAASLRVSLGEMLQAGRGGPADPERAKSLYIEAVKATGDREAFDALQKLGIDAGQYLNQGVKDNPDAGDAPAEDDN